MLVNGPADAVALNDGKLADIAPTMLDLMNMPKPVEMTGQTLIRRDSARRAAE